MKVREKLDASAPIETLDASLISAAVFDELINMDLSTVGKLDVSHNDLCSSDGTLESDVILEQRKKVNAEAVIKEGRLLTEKSHKEKDFAVGAAKRREGKSLQEKGEAALQEANHELETLNERMTRLPWSSLLDAGLPRELVANNCGIQAANLQLLGDKNVSEIRRIALDGNYFGDDGAAEVANIMKQSDALEELSIRNTGMTDMGISVILAALVSNNTLTRLDLRSNHLATKASEAAIKGMRHFNKTATVLF